MMPQNNTVRLRRYIIWSIVIATLSAVGGLVINSFAGKSSVILIPKTGTTITIGASKDDQPALDKIITSSNTQKTVRLAKGNYVVLFSGGTYVDKYTVITVDAAQKIETPVLSYKPEKLAFILTQEQQAINTAIAGGNFNGYSATDGKLYIDGTWYAAKLTPNNPSTADTRLIILQKKNGSWVVVAGPRIVFFIGDYPQIPEAVIRDINNR